MSMEFTSWNPRYLEHHGIKGQKWGVRRYQNEDGTLTALGKLRGGREARKENRNLKKTLADEKKYRKEYSKERLRAQKRAIKDDKYREAIADLEAHRLNMDPERTKEWFDALEAGRRAADNIMWYKYGDRGYNNIVNKQASGEKIAKSILGSLSKRGVSIANNGRRWQEMLDKENGRAPSGQNAFEGETAKSTLYLLQAQREIENKRRNDRREQKLTKYTTRRDNHLKSSKVMDHYRQQAEKEGKKGGEAWTNYKMLAERGARKASRYQKKIDRITRRR